ncbi:MAG: acyl-CoA dehydrogenase [Desulfobacterales bacterium]|nr:acyl-CoA dehydrogenase [Desulfobacterales bacterium]
MAQQIADRRDIDFVLHEQLQVASLSRHEAFAEFNRKTVDLIVSEARQLALKELLPLHKVGDEEGCRLEDGRVNVPEAFHRAYGLLCEGEWIAMCDDARWGGQEMPQVVAQAANNYFYGANYPFMTYATLTHGAGKLVEVFGTDQQKKLFLEKMYAGQWGGTMLLTEPEAGSDVGALTTTARRNEDGTYALTGNKIFITCGENDLVENIIHPVLARIEGAPEGTRGISLFLVPKYWVADDGRPGARNDIVCTGLEEKMGIHGSATCSMTLGSKGQCRGLLLGEENKGMAAMFVMMNEARLGVGMQGFGCASASFLNALNYARERIQGRPLSGGAAPVAIIQHPDVRRMLLTMKAYTEGMRSLLLYVAFCEDLARVHHGTASQARYQGLIDLLIPIAKGYVTDKSYEICNHGLQVFGGYGYTREYPQEQLLRDCKITQIYEGTNGIQAMDLIGRKLALGGGEPFRSLLVEIGRTVEEASRIPDLNDLAVRVKDATRQLKAVAEHMAGSLRSEQMPVAFAFACPFMEVTGDTVMAWMLLWRATIAQQKIAAGVKKKDRAFYDGQLKSAQYFINTQLPVTLGRMAAILTDDDAVTAIAEEAFGGK